MKKQKNNRSEQPNPQLSEDDHEELAWEEDFRREQEARHSALQKLSKAELIQMVIDLQDREEEFAAWLLSNGGGRQLGVQSSVSLRWLAFQRQ